MAHIYIKESKPISKLIYNMKSGSDKCSEERIKQSKETKNYRR